MTQGGCPEPPGVIWAPLHATATGLARDGARFEIDVLGEMRTATVRLEPLYDPQGLRLRS